MEEDKIKKSAAALRLSAYLLAVTLVFMAFSALCNTETPVVLAPEGGILDLTGADFNGHNVTIAEESFLMYPGTFYLPEDFAAGGVAQAGVRYDSPGEVLGDYGTLRLELRLPPGEVYALAGRSVSYAQRLFIDGKEYTSIGRPGTSSDAVTPKSMRYMEAFAAQSDSTEIVIHYSAFVHADGGGLYPLELGLAGNVARAGQLEVFRIAAVTFALLTAMLFFFGMFLFFGKSRYFLWFSLACGCIALRGLLTGDKAIMLLLPNLDWYFAIRLEYLTTCGMAFFSAQYLSALFPGAAKRWAMRGYTIFCVLNAAFVCLTPPLTFTRHAAVFTWVYVLFSAYLLATVLISVLHKKRAAALPPAEQLLLLAGFLIYLLLAALGIRAHRYNTYLWGLDYPQVGMMAFLFINILALVLGFARTERELDKARRSEREMEETNRTLKRLNRVRAVFLSNITHELKTPLAGINSMAQYIRAKLRSGGFDEEADSGLGDITDRSLWLAEYVERLLEQSMEQQDKLDFAVVPIVPLLHQAAKAADPLLKARGNRLTIETDKALPPLSGISDMLLRVLLNLIGNANRHSEGNAILLTAKANDGMAEIRVTDHGGGIPKELLPRVFLRGVSGDKSSGLGLAICKEIVETHGGRINITSAGGKGTEVWFTIPFAKEEAL